MNAFKRLHDPVHPLLLPNAWDCASARIIEECGFKAIGTTSAAVAWAMGYPDGEALERSEMIAAIARIAECVSLPVTADIESGYGTAIEDLIETLELVRDAGAVGCNIEDYSKSEDRLYTPAEAAERICRVKQTFTDDIFINARTDIFLKEIGAPEDRLPLTIERIKAYVEAGADSVFVPGVYDAERIRALASSVRAPLNILVRAATPPLDELQRLGVARVSTGSAIALRVFGEARSVAAQMLQTGEFSFARHPNTMSYEEANALF